MAKNVSAAWNESPSSVTGFSPNEILEGWSHEEGTVEKIRHRLITNQLRDINASIPQTGNPGKKSVGFSIGELVLFKIHEDKKYSTPFKKGAIVGKSLDSFTIRFLTGGFVSKSGIIFHL